MPARHGARQGGTVPVPAPRFSDGFMRWTVLFADSRASRVWNPKDFSQFAYKF